MKKILISLSAVLGVAALVSAATYAAFSTTTTITGNTVSTATISLTQNNTGYPGYAFKPITVTNMYPGSTTTPEYVGLHNTSAVPLKVSMLPNELTGLCGEYTLTVDVYPYNHPTAPATTPGTAPWNVYSGSLSGMATTTLSASLAANARVTVRQTLTLSSSAGNEYQNTSCAWVENFVGETI